MFVATLLLKVHILTVPWCSCIATVKFVKFCCIITRLEICSSRVMATFCDCGVFIQFTSLILL